MSVDLKYTVGTKDGLSAMTLVPLSSQRGM
jgi:hypothetical protein